MKDPKGLMGKVPGVLIKQLAKRGFKKGVEKGAEENPDSHWLQELDDAFNPELMKDPMYEDSDGDGASDYYDDDSNWDKARNTWKD